MTKSQLYEIVAQETGLSKKAATKAVNAVLKAIKDATLKKSEEVFIPGFGKFYARVYPKRKVKITDFKTGKVQIVEAPASRTISFKPFKGSRKMVRG